MKPLIHIPAQNRGALAPRICKTALVASFACLLASSSLAQIPSLVFTQRWALGPGSRFDIPAAADNFTRGVAINKLTGNILLASRTSSNHIAVLNGSDGSELGTFGDNTQISGGTLALIHVRVADDGVIYACNLTAGTSSLKIYRWNSEADALAAAPAAVVFGPAAPGAATTQRYGDSMDLRGAGTNTQIVISGSGSTVYAVFTTTDGTNFTATEFTHGLGTGELGKGISFDGTNNAIYGKKDTSLILHRVAFDIPTVTSTLLTNITLPSTDGNVVGTEYAEANGVKFVTGGMNGTGTTAAGHRFKAYTINNPNAVQVSADVAYPGPYLGDGNILGANDVANNMAVTEQSNNGLMLFDIGYVSNLPPSVVTQPADQTNVLAGGYVSFSVGANGTAPLSFRWKFNDTNNVPGGTNSTLTLTNLSASDAGLYSCVVTNASGSVTSSAATLVVIPSVLSAAAVPLWSKSAGDLFFLANDNAHRGVAYNPAANHVIVVSRTPSNGVHVLDPATGAYIRSLDMSAVTLLPPTVTFAVSMVGVADDGAVYVADLGDVTTVPGNHYQIYRWADDAASTVASIAYPDGDPGVGRIGDTLAVRGAGTNTQILASSRNGTQVVLFTTADGTTFTPNIIDVTTEPVGFAGLGIGFGAGDTFWAKSSGIQFRHVAFDLVNATNGLLQTFAAGQTTSVALAADPVNDLLAGVVPNVSGRPIPDHVDLYDVHEVVNGLSAEPTLIDEDFFKTANVNGNGTGAAAFDVTGGRLFALDTNNGLLALKVVARLFAAPVGNNLVLTWTGPSVLQSSANVAGTYLDVSGATSPRTNAMAASQQYYRLRR